MYNCIWSMEKILFVFNHPAPYKVRLFNELSKTFDVHVIFERQKATDRNKRFYFEDEYKFTLHKIKNIPIGKENVISSGVIKHIKENKYDFIVMNGYSNFAEIKTIKYLKKNKIPYVLYINGGIIKQKECLFKKNLKTKLISGAMAYLSPDKESNKYLVYYGAEASRIFNYPYSTIYKSEICKTEPDKNSYRNELGLIFDKIFVSSGQLIKRKNYLSLVKEWKNYPSDYALILLGDGNEKNKILRFIHENNMQNVILSGFVDREMMFKYFRASDVFLFPSNEDIYGHVINEALSQGIPVVSSKHVNSSIKLIRNGYNGFLVEKFNGDKLKDDILFCVENDMYDACIETANENTIEKMAKAHIDIFRRIKG